MRNFPTIALTLLLTFITIPAQDTAKESSDKFSAPINWARYKFPAAGAEILLPKLPADLGGLGGNGCTEVDGRIYTAYADESVYEFRYSVKSENPAPSWCKEIIPFGSKALEQRITAIRTPSLAKVVENDTQFGSRAIKTFRAESANAKSVRWLITDLNNKRWLEIAIHSRPEKKVDEMRFFESLELTMNSGIDVGKGSPAMKGDPGLPASGGGEGSEKLTNGLTLLYKPRPGYTDGARDRNTQGTVMLKVDFLANGGIGEVSVVKALPSGLTEQAISAAKRIAFLPQRSNGSAVTVTKQVEYTFSIY